MNIIKLGEHKELLKQSARFFHTHWCIPIEVYEESIKLCMKNNNWSIKKLNSTLKE